MRVAVTGAFGYSGQYIARRLLADGNEVATLTNSVQRANPFGNRVQVLPFNFDRPELLAKYLAGAEALINTYWVRFDHKLFTHAQAVANTRVLFDAARHAGVRRIVHVSITNPDLQSDLPYFKGKAELENALQSSAWLIASCGPPSCSSRKTSSSTTSPGRCGDFRSLVFSVRVIISCSPSRWTIWRRWRFRRRPRIRRRLSKPSDRRRSRIVELVEMIASKIGVKRRIIGVSPMLGYWACQLAGAVVQDVIITREEIRGLMENRLFVNAPPLGWTKLSEWAAHRAATLGLSYTSEMNRRLDRQAAYRGN